jgi:DNA-binding LacI/PurR family transcriptional regulator
MGARAVELLVRLLAGEQVESQRLPPVLIARASTQRY